MSRPSSQVSATGNSGAPQQPAVAGLNQRRASQQFTVDPEEYNAASATEMEAAQLATQGDDGTDVLPTQCPTSQAARQFLENALPTTVGVDTVKNVPLSIGCTMVTIAFVDPRGKVLAPLSELPSAAFLQSDTSPCSSPTFARALVVARCKPKTQAVITVTCIDHRTKARGVLGHAIVSLFGKRGVFEMRVRPGDLNGNSTMDDDTGAQFLPLTSVVVRVNVRPGDAADDGVIHRLFDLNHNEELLLLDRKGHTNSIMAAFGLTKALAERVLQDPGATTTTGGTTSGGTTTTTTAANTTQGTVARPLDLSFYAPYNESRGVAVVVHAVHFAVPADRSPLQLFKVVAEVDGRLSFTMYHDWRADAFRPRFLDAQFVFDNVRMRSNAAAILRVYRLRFHPHASVVEPTDRRLEFNDVGVWSIEEYGWTMAALQARVGKGVLRHSPTIALPLYAGRVPDDLADVLRQHETIEDAVTTMTSRGAIAAVKPTIGSHRPLVTVSIADPARLQEVAIERVGSNAECRNPLATAFKAAWVYPSHVQAHANAYFKHVLFTQD